MIFGGLWPAYFCTGSEGTGLGLAIVKRIVSQHQGAVVVNNRSQGGLKAQISFPVKS